MSPWSEGHNVRFWVLMAFCAAIAIACYFGISTANDAADRAADNTKQNRLLIKQLRDQSMTFAHETCVASNAAKQVVFNILVAADRADPTPNSFYQQQEAEVKKAIIPCPPLPER